MPRYAFEDFEPGFTVETGPRTVGEDEIVAFARAYDPQPMHLDPVLAASTFAGRLIASGWHTAGLGMRLTCDGLVADSTCMGSPGVDELRWLRPVGPGDRLRVRLTVEEVRALRSRPDRGIVRWQSRMLDQDDAVVMTQSFAVLFGKRGAPAPAAQSRDSRLAEVAPAPAAGAETVPFFENVTVGDGQDLGTYHFPAHEVVAFARDFDPQGFHTDEEAARRSHFGALCASGWHTAAAFMRCKIERREAARARALGRGDRPAGTGTSPGLRDLRWLKPVYAGDTISYRTEVVEKRASRFRPDWGILHSRNTGDNQHGERVVEFIGAEFRERRARVA